jgi:DnaK suppressor protein
LSKALRQRLAIAQNDSGFARRKNKEITAMEAIAVKTLFDRLTMRQAQLMTTLRHLDNEQKEVAQNTDWRDQAAQESRVALLDELNRGYQAEMKRIDRALQRIEKHGFGICAACHDPIDAKRLQAAPEAEYCGACAKFREGFEQQSEA